MIDPASLSIPKESPVESYIYFSFVTLTTVRYGDFVPLKPLARHLAVLEAFTGQLYLAIFVSRLVGLHLSSAKSNEPRR
jgi:hypothetical protein